MIIKFFKDNSQKDDRGSDISLVKIISLLIHAAKMITPGVFMVCKLSPLFEYAPSNRLYDGIIDK